MHKYTQTRGHMHRQTPTHAYKQEIPYEEIQKTIDTNEDEVFFQLIIYFLFSVIDNLKNFFYSTRLTRPGWFNVDP